MLDSVLVWDAEESPPFGDWTTVLWRGFVDSASPDAISMPNLVEDQADTLKARYLAWIYELGETRIEGRRLVDHLELRPGFSYWWMTLIAEKCNYAQSPQITDAIRLLCFENWASSRSIGRVILSSPNARLAECMRSWCANRGVGFEWRRMAGVAADLSWLKRVYQALPISLQALAWLVRHLVQSWPLRGIGLQNWRQTVGSVTLASYLFNLVPDAVKEGRFQSRYWAHLPADLQSEGCNTNWLHLYVKDALLPTVGKAVDAIRQFNTTGRGEQTHVTLDAFLGARVICKTLRDWLRMGRAGRRMEQTFSLPLVAELHLWPLFRQDWHRSMVGQPAMNNLLFFNLLELAMKLLPKQRTGVYLFENQPWEFALIHAWKAAGHGRLIGAQHATMLYWDLRYFFDPRTYNQRNGNDLPLPDQIAVNGPAAMDICLKGGYPERDVVEVEALRYLYLAEASAELDSVSPSLNDSLHVLVLGDYLLSNTQRQMRLLAAAARSLPTDTIITVKPHPNLPILPSDYPSLRMELTMEPLGKLLAQCDVAYTSGATSAAVDAYCAGVPVVSVLDPNTLNLSPLRGHEGVLFASRPEGLAHALITAASTPRQKGKRQDYLTLDPSLPRWRRLLL
jgi:surface carbohydrate biosynthesis protein (TIGR04326 family)